MSPATKRATLTVTETERTEVSKSSDAGEVLETRWSGWGLAARAPLSRPETRERGVPYRPLIMKKSCPAARNFCGAKIPSGRVKLGRTARRRVFCAKNFARFPRVFRAFFARKTRGKRAENARNFLHKKHAGVPSVQVLPGRSEFLLRKNSERPGNFFS